MWKDYRYVSDFNKKYKCVQEELQVDVFHISKLCAYIQ